MSTLDDEIHLLFLFRMLNPQIQKYIYSTPQAVSCILFHISKTTIAIADSIPFDRRSVLSNSAGLLQFKGAYIIFHIFRLQKFKKKSSCHNFMMCGVKMFNAEQSRHNHIATLDGENTFADPVLHVTHNLYVVSSLSVRLQQSKTYPCLIKYHS